MASEDLFRRRPTGFFAVSLLDNFVVKQVAAQVVHVFVGVRRSEVAVDGVGLGFTVQVGSHEVHQSVGDKVFGDFALFLAV